jgi:TonB family protein
MGRISDYNSKIRKRFIVVIPISLLIMILIIFLIERFNMPNKLFNIGYEGPQKSVPEIVIEDESKTRSESFSREKNPMIVKDITLPEEEKRKPEDNGKKPQKHPNVSSDDFSIKTIPGESYYRTYQSRADVPYSEDYVILKMVEPEYPKSAINQGLEGYVIVEVYVSEKGNVEEAYVRSAFGPTSFETSSLKAIRQFLFKPLIQNGKPTPFWVSFIIRFNFTSRH